MFNRNTEHTKYEIRRDTANVIKIKKKQATERDQNNCCVAYLQELVTTMTMDKGSWRG